jgi:FkbM family methyltransferase
MTGNLQSSTGEAVALKACRHGRMLYLRNDIFVGRSLDLYGEFCEGEGDLFNQLLSPGQVAVEVGANIGAHTVHIAQLVGPSGLVLAFEPQPALFYLLCGNLALNEQFHVRAYRAAVGSAPGRINVPILDPKSTANFGGVSMQQAGGEAVTQLALDRFTLPSLRLLKIDVEGMETEVLLGARETIRRHRPILYVENDRRQNSARLIGLITELGYRLYWHLPPLFSANNFARNPENVFPGIVSVNMLGVPNDMPTQFTGFRQVTGPDDQPPLR